MKTQLPLSLRRGGEDSPIIKDSQGVRSKVFHIRRQILIPLPFKQTTISYSFIMKTRLPLSLRRGGGRLFNFQKLSGGEVKDVSYTLTNPYHPSRLNKQPPYPFY